MDQAWQMEENDEELSNNTLLLVHGVHPALSKEALRNQFIRFGDVVSANVTTNSRGNPMGFVQMKSVRDCTAAIAGLNGHAPLHWTVQLSLPAVEMARRRKLRQEARQFEEEMRPIREARQREFAEHQQNMLRLTREFTASLAVDPESAASDGDAPTHAPLAEDQDGGGDGWPLEPGQQPCSVCTLPTSGYCQRCRTPYCSRQCQTADWDKHRHTCERAPSLVVSVEGSGDPVAGRSVQYGRAASARLSPTPAPAPVPLRRPRSVSGGGDCAATRGPSPKKAPTAANGLHSPNASRAPHVELSPQAAQPPQAGQSPQAAQSPRAAQSPQTGLLPHAGQSPRAGRSPQSVRMPDPLGRVLLQPGQRYEVVVVYAADPSAVYLRLRHQMPLVEALEQQVRRQLETQPAAPLPTVGQVCAARFEGAWYRGSVLAVQAGQYRVHFLDWGNTASLSAADVTPLTSPAAGVPAQAVRAALPWRPKGAAGDWSRHQRRGLAALDGRPLTASVLTAGPPATVALFNEDGKSVLDVIGEGAPVDADDDADATDARLPPQAQLLADRKHLVVPTSMEHLQRVTAQLRDVTLYRPYLAMTRRLQAAAAAAPCLSAVPAPGSAVSVLTAPIGGVPTWHRATVLPGESDRLTIHLLDWGCSETAELGRLRTLEPALCQTTSIGVEFGLLGLSASGCSEQELEFYRNKLLGKDWLLEACGVMGGVTQAKLHLSSDTNPFCFNDKLQSRLADPGRKTVAPEPAQELPRSAKESPRPSPATSPRPSPATAALPRPLPASPRQPQLGPLFVADLPEPPVVAGSVQTFMLADVVGADLFYGTPLTEASAEAVWQLEADVPRLVELHQPAQCPAPRPGQLVVMRGTQATDGWCRAAVQEVTPAGVLVCLLEYGKLERVPANCLRLMPSQLAQRPTSVIALSLQGSERFSAAQRQLAVKMLTGDGCEETLLELTVVRVGRPGSATVVSCADIDSHLLLT